MEVVAHDMTKLVRLCAAVRLEGQLYAPQAAMLFVERYKFVGVPRSLDELSGDRVSFKQGLFNGSAIETFDIFNDGVVITSKSPSDLLEAFFEDVAGWMGKALGLTLRETHKVNKAFESHLIVHTDAPILGLLERLAPIQDLLGRLVQKAMGVEAKFQPVNFGLSPDALSIPTMKPIAFRFERRNGLSFESNYYFSAAPLPTDDHVKVLKELEKLVQ